MKIIFRICCVAYSFFKRVLEPAYENFNSLKFYDLPGQLNAILKVLILGVYYSYHLFEDCFAILCGRAIDK